MKTLVLIMKQAIKIHRMKKNISNLERALEIYKVKSAKYYQLSTELYEVIEQMREETKHS